MIILTVATTQVLWVCILCRKKQELLIRSGKWSLSTMAQRLRSLQDGHSYSPSFHNSVMSNHNSLQLHSQHPQHSQQQLQSQPQHSQQRFTAPPMSSLSYSTRYGNSMPLQTQHSIDFGYTSGGTSSSAAATAARRNQYHRRAFSSEKEWVAARMSNEDQFLYPMPDHLHTARSAYFAASFDSRNNSPSRRAMLPTVPPTTRNASTLIHQASLSEQPTATYRMSTHYANQGSMAMQSNSIISRSASSSTCSTLIGTTITAHQAHSAATVATPPVATSATSATLNPPNTATHVSRILSSTGQLLQRGLPFKSHSTERYPGKLNSHREFGSPHVGRTRPIVQPNDFPYDDGFEIPLTTGRRLSGNLGMPMYSNSMQATATISAPYETGMNAAELTGAYSGQSQPSNIGAYGQLSHPMTLLNLSAPSLLNTQQQQHQQQQQQQQPQPKQQQQLSQQQASQAQMNAAYTNIMILNQANVASNAPLGGFGFLSKAKNLLSGSVGSLIGNKGPSNAMQPISAANMMIPTGMQSIAAASQPGFFGPMSSGDAFSMNRFVGSEPNMANAMAYQANQASMGGFGPNTLMQPAGMQPLMSHHPWRTAGTTAALALGKFEAAKRLPVPQTSIIPPRNAGQPLRHQLSFSNSENECDCHDDELHTSGCSSGAEEIDAPHLSRTVAVRSGQRIGSTAYVDDEEDYEEDEEENSLEGRLAMGSRQSGAGIRAGSATAISSGASCSWHLAEEGTRMIGRLHLDAQLFSQFRRRVQQSRVRMDGLLSVMGVRVGFGSIRGQRSAVVVKLKRNSFAHSIMRLNVGDRLLEWNGLSLLNRSLEQIVQVIADSLHEPQINVLIARDANFSTGSGKYTQSGVLFKLVSLNLIYI